MIRPLTILVLLAVAACTSPKNWVAVHADKGFGEFWEGFAQIAERQGYVMDKRESDRGLRIFVSKWRETPAPFGMGSRSRLHGKFTRPEDGGAGWNLEFYIQKQVVKAMEPGFEPDESDWSDAGQDGVREDVILGQLRLRFGQDLGIGPTYRKKK